MSHQLPWMTLYLDEPQVIHTHFNDILDLHFELLDEVNVVDKFWDVLEDARITSLYGWTSQKMSHPCGEAILALIMFLAPRVARRFSRPGSDALLAARIRATFNF